MTTPNGLSSLLGGVDAILAARDLTGFVKQPVYFLRRTWFTDSGLSAAASAPEGYAVDVLTQVLPSPGIKSYAQNLRLMEAGVIKQGDILLTGISKNKFHEADLDGSSSAPNIENLFMVGVKVYQVINVTQKYVTFSVLLRELSNQTRY